MFLDGFGSIEKQTHGGPVGQNFWDTAAAAAPGITNSRYILEQQQHTLKDGVEGGIEPLSWLIRKVPDKIYG